MGYRAAEVHAITIDRFGCPRVEVRINGEERRITVAEEPETIALDAKLESFELDRNFYMTVEAR